MSEKFQHKKSLGQNFLNSDYVPKKMCDAANLQAGEVVLEIGPGTGALTKEILKRGGVVVAVEADGRAISALEEAFPEEIARHQLTIHHQDARKLDLAGLGLKNQEFKVISNIPYYLSGLLFRTILDNDTQPNTLVFLIQKEVAERIAREEKESLLSLSIKAFGEPTYICTVKRGYFTPPPKIDSAIVAINNINQDNFRQISAKQFFDLLHLGFGQKRKQLLGNLSKQFNKDCLNKQFDSNTIDTKTRAEDLGLEQWLRLAESIVNNCQ